MKRREFITGSAAETEILGEEFSQNLRRGDVLLLYGELGTGKTTFTRGICRAFGVNFVKSPSFVIVNVYDGGFPIFHIDLYRLEEIEPDTTGEIMEYLWNEDGISIVEWADRLPDEIVPEKAIKFYFERISEIGRNSTIEAWYEKWQ